ncbi:MAG: SMP-30/gluconolactonase/LRE family protein [Chloroflexi bacterium]|nr:SMP-30/gluconolactonase/LRE family protein [Chloroflexota bacterium]
MSPAFERLVPLEPADAGVPNRGYGTTLREVGWLERVAGGFGFTEGPVWLGDSLIFSDIVRSRIVRFRPLDVGPEITTFRQRSNRTNGMTLDREGRLLACEGGTRRVTRTEADGTLVTLVDSFEGRPLNAPNDVAVSASGAVYFTDHPWAHLFRDPDGPEYRPDENPQGTGGVYRVDPDGRTSRVVDRLRLPNGVAFSPSGDILYVTDSGSDELWAFGVRGDGSLDEGRCMATLRAGASCCSVDGLKIDVDGNIFTTGNGGIWVLTPAGEVLGRVVCPEPAINLAWGDADYRTLYVTAFTSVYRFRTARPGIRTW